MPIIERKTLDRVNREDILYMDAGNLIKAGQKIDDKIGVLAKYNVSHITVISPTREEKIALSQEKIDELIEKSIDKRRRKNREDLRFNLFNTLQNFHEPYAEKDQLFSIPGKRNYLDENELLSRKLDSLNYNQVQAGSSRIVDKYKLRYAGEVLSMYQSFTDKLKPLEAGEKEAEGSMKRIFINSIRLNSFYEDKKLRNMGDSLSHQSIDIALMFLHTMININKKRIQEGRPFSESRWDPSQKKTDHGVYQYKSELIHEAAMGILLHNIGNAHRAVNQIISGKPILSSNEQSDLKKIKFLQKSIFILKHMLDREDVSSISRMMCVMQKDYPDGTGAPSPNENRFLFEFVRLFQLVAFYDNLTNPVNSRTVFSRIDVINYIKNNSGEYKFSPDKFRPQPKFDSYLVNEFLNVLAPYELNEKVYLYEKGKRNYPLFVGKVVSYPDSYIPLISVLKDEKNNKAYRDGSLFIHIPSSSLYLKSAKGTSRKIYPWISNLEIFDKNVNAGNLDEYSDPVYGNIRSLKNSR